MTEAVLVCPSVLSCLVLWAQPPRSGLKDGTKILTKLSSILMRASNSCSPSRLFCMGPKVLPAHCTEPTSCGRCFSCSRRIRFSVPPALDRADTYREIRTLSHRGMKPPNCCGLHKEAMGPQRRIQDPERSRELEGNSWTLVGRALTVMDQSVSNSSSGSVLREPQSGRNNKY